MSQLSLEKRAYANLPYVLATFDPSKFKMWPRQRQPSPQEKTSFLILRPLHRPASRKGKAQAQYVGVVSWTTVRFVHSVRTPVGSYEISEFSFDFFIWLACIYSECKS